MEALTFARQLGFDELDVESDCFLLISVVKQNICDQSDVGRLVGDCRVSVSSFQSIKVSHINRKANGVVNRLAHLASYSSLDKSWVDESPVIIQDVLYEDLCNITRGEDYMSPSMSFFNSNNTNQAWG